MSEEHLRSQLLEMVKFLGLLTPLLLLAALATGSFLARQALRPIDLMVSQVRDFRATTLNQRLSILNPDDELGHLAAVINDLLARLHDAFEKLKRFTADASHELRTPLTTMRSVGEVGLQPGQPPERYREVIGSMLEENERLSSLIDSLLFLSRADADAVRLSHDHFDLADLLKESRDIIAILADEKGQSIMVRAPAPLPVTADKTLLRRALLNLIDNAIKYSPRGGDIEIAAESATGPLVRIRIRDTGPGIPPEHQSRVFDRFFRIEDSRSREAGGTGLGLSIVHWVVSAHGGRVWIESRSPGTDVVLEMPIGRDTGIRQV
jgi:heavy metal sensor kinase